ncbi:MAG: response regulator, partial [Deltaproteobacteria bacterium]
MSEAKRTVLVADDEANLRKVLSALLRREGYEVLSAADGEEAWEILQKSPVDVLLTDLKMPRLDGMTLLERVLEAELGVPVVMLTAHGTVDTAVTAMKLGAFDYLTKPYDQEELRLIIQKAAATADLATTEPAEAVEGRFGIIGRSPALEEVFVTIEKVAASPSTVLITGESGTGKELVAAALHKHSPRKDKPFIKINCAAIPRDLIESELFGYERGAFTG